MSTARRPGRKRDAVASRQRARSSVGCFIILGILAVGAVVGVAYVHTRLHQTTALDTVFAALYGAGGACLVSLALGFLLGLPVLLRTQTAGTLSFLVAIVAGLVAWFVTMHIVTMPEQQSAAITGTSVVGLGATTYLTMKAPPGKRLQTLIQGLLRTVGSGGDD